MRQEFPGYFSPTEDEYAELWTDGLIVLDTNSLLNLYRYSDSTRRQFLEVLESVRDRLWIPWQVAHEFLERRFDVIHDQQAAYGQMRDALVDSRKSLEGVANRYKRHPALDIDALMSRVTTHFDSLREELDERESAHPLSVEMARSTDPIADKVVALFAGRIGQNFDAAELKATYKEGAERYALKIPPGYKDSGKGEPGMYGDLVLWKQLLTHVADTRRTSIFVTDDAKEDWWRQFRGQKIGPRPELVDEYYQAADKRMHIYSPEQFLRESEERLGLAAVSPETLGEVERVSKVDPERVRAVVERRLGDLTQQRERLRQLVNFRSNPAPAASRLTQLQERRDVAAREVADLEAALQSMSDSDQLLVGTNLKYVVNAARGRLAEVDQQIEFTQRRPTRSNPYPAQLLAIDEEIAETQAALQAWDGSEGAS